jgi:arginine transport system substrate-binding protein
VPLLEKKGGETTIKFTTGAVPMKKLLLAATILAGITFNAAAADTIRFASSATYPPFESLDANNQIVGFDIDLAKALCKQMQADCTFTNQAFDSLIAALKFKKYDAVISGMDITPERSKQVTFTQPYYANSAIVIAQKGKFTTLADLKGKKLGMENGTTHQKYMQDKHPEINTVSYDSYQNAVLELKNGRIDGVFGDTAVVNEWLKNNPELAAVGEHVTDAQYFGTGLGIAVRPDNQALLAKLNAALDAIKADGTYKAINDKWFPQ